ncbi:MAG: hypothetical protein JWQ40_503 [Segetibacter sp.]|nr:hypothetical protein [Segetibacter sp.]
MLFNDAGFLYNTIGMPTSHKNAFLNVALSQGCIILVRATGPTCLTLLAEGYDTKGYRIHGKSCDWGPMAGFVMRDPRLSKKGRAGIQFNRESHIEALSDAHDRQGWVASTTPLKISASRIAWLVSKRYITVVQKAPDRLDGFAQHSTGIQFYYSLIREPSGLYGVYFDNSQHGKKWIQEKGSQVVYYHPRYGSAYEPMLAMTNPAGHRLHAADHYLNAMTGDYDLFAIWPYVSSYDARLNGEDHRPLGTIRGSSQEEKAEMLRRRREFTQGGQGGKMGNITPRIYMVCAMVNSLLGNRQVLKHSDELGRPGVDDVDLPLIAFTPSNSYYGITSITDFENFIIQSETAGFKVTLSNGWTLNPTNAKPNRLGAAFDRLVPADGIRVRVPDWFNS